MTAEQAGNRSRGISPNVGAALLVAMVTILAVTTGYILVGISGETDPQPNAGLELERAEDNVTFVLRHRSGEPIDGNKTEIAGVGDEDALDGKRFQAGENVRIVPVDDEVMLLWYGENTGHIIQTFDVDISTQPHGIANISSECPWVEQNIDANGDLDMNGDKAVCDVTEDTNTSASDIDMDLDGGSVLVGDIDTDGDVDVDSSVVAGSVTTTSSDITVTDNSNIYGDVVASPGTNIDIDGNSNVAGDVVVDGGSVSLNNADVDGHVYATPGDVSGCSTAELGPNDKSCAAYSFRDPSDYDG